MFTSSMFSYISPLTLKEQLIDTDELALLDVREELTFGTEHLLYASCLPLSQLELLVPTMLQRLAVPIVLCDGGEGFAEKAAAKLAHFGYQQIAILEGGIKAWKAAGFEVFSGVHVPSKAFGEFIETEYHTPSVSADELHNMLEANEDLVILDSRPMIEYHARNIPSGQCVPGGELAYRVHDLAPSPDTLVVVNCAGRTRSIIGAQSLINAGIPNKVVALRNGTMGWHLAGHKLETGMIRTYREVSSEGLTKARQVAERVKTRFKVQSIDQAMLERWQAERDQHSLYLLDVRSPEDYVIGHLPGSLSAPGGQLVQETNQFIPTLHARIVLIDDTGVRATMAASWLNQMGWDQVVVLENGLADLPLESGAGIRKVLGLENISVDTISASELNVRLSQGSASIVDLSLSRNYKNGHIPGAWFAIRARLAQSLSQIPLQELLVLTSEDGTLAQLTAAEVAEIVSVPVKVLIGGNDSWKAANLPFNQGEEHMADVIDDIWLKPYEKDWGVESAMQDYLTWEVGLVPQIERDGTSQFWPKN